MIRKFQPEDGPRVASIWYESGRQEYTYLADFQALNSEQAAIIFHDVIVANCAIWVETRSEDIRGFIAMQNAYIDRLYTDPQFQGLGVGTTLIQHAMQIMPHGLQLHTHQANKRARCFYEKLGFKAVKYGTSPAPECMPDVEYHWLGLLTASQQSDS